MTTREIGHLSELGLPVTLLSQCEGPVWDMRGLKGTRGQHWPHKSGPSCSWANKHWLTMESGLEGLPQDFPGGQSHVSQPAGHLTSRRSEKPSLFTNKLTYNVMA